MSERVFAHSRDDPRLVEKRPTFASRLGFLALVQVPVSDRAKGGVLPLSRITDAAAASVY